MKHRYQKPPAPLSEYVRTTLILEGSGESSMDTLPLFTNGLPALVCRTENSPTGPMDITVLTLYGKSTPPECWTLNNSTSIVAYFFNPFALACLFNLSASRLAEAPVDLANWSPHKTNALKTQLAYARSISEKAEILDHLLLHLLDQNKRVCEIIAFSTNQIMYDSSTEILSILLKKLDLNERTFQRIFKKHVGISPNQYRRICQFQLSFEQLRTKKFNKVSDVAFDNGFSDQSHFIRSFKEFAKTTPNDYLHKGLTDKKK